MGFTNNHTDSSKEKKAPPSQSILATGTLIKRYIITGLVGSGENSVVYRAYDPKLGRQVAIKLIQTDSNSADDNNLGNSQFLQSARTMAKLSHPNIIQIYEVGDYKNQIFLIMDFIKGQSIDSWLTTPTPDWKEVFLVMKGLAQGLEAAHQVGLHCGEPNFGNVLITKNAEAIITGLKDNNKYGSTNNSNKSLEQDIGLFISTLHRTFIGFEPGDKNPVHQKKISSPRWFKKTITNAMKADPGKKIDSLSQLIDSLDPGHRTKIVGFFSVILFFCISAIILWAKNPLSVNAKNLCQNANQYLTNVWDQKAKQNVYQTFLATKRPYALNTFQKVENILDNYTDDWQLIHTQACLATHVNKSQTPRLLDLRMQCLNRNLQKLSILVEIFESKPDPVIVDKAVKAASNLSNLSKCSDTQVLTAAYPPPEDLQTKKQIERYNKLLDRAESFAQAGKYKQGFNICHKVAKETRDLDYPPFQAAFNYSHGWLYSKIGNYQDSVNSLRQALTQSAKARDDELIAKTTARLIYIVGYKQAKVGQALDYCNFAQLSVQRAGNNSALLVNFYTRIASVLVKGGQLKQAQKYLQKTLEIRSKVLKANHPEIASTLNNLGVVLDYQGMYKQAQLVYRKSIEITSQAYGSNHPSVAQTYHNLGGVYYSLGDFSKAQVYYKKGLTILEAVLEKNHPHLGTSLNNLANALFYGGKIQPALNYYRQALELRETVLETNHPDIAFSLTGLGRCMLHLNKAEEAINFLERALDIRENEKVDLGIRAETRFTLAKALWQKGQNRSSAIRHVQKAKLELSKSNRHDLRIMLPEIEAWLDKNALVSH